MSCARFTAAPLVFALVVGCGAPPEDDLGGSTGPQDGSTSEPGSESGPAPATTGGMETTGATTGDPTGSVDDSTTDDGSGGESSSSGGADVTCEQVRVLVAPGADLNLRPSPSTAEDPVGTLANADVLDVLDEVDGELIEGTEVWLHVESATADGYISAAHASCAVDECAPFEIPEAEYLTYGLHPDASHALVHLGITEDRITQTIGSAPDSAGTHAQDGTAEDYPYSAATDLRVLGLSEDDIRQYIADLAVAGYAGWYRSPGSDGVPADWSPHIHAVWVGAPMKLSLRNQVRSWIEGRNGLVSDTPYEFHQWPECVRDAVWERYLENNPAEG